MKFICILFLILTSLANAEGLLPKDIIGLWKTTHLLEKQEGLRTEINEIALFLEDGSAYAEGLVRIEQDEADLNLLSIGGPDLLEWSIKKGNLNTQIKKSEYNLTLSVLDPKTLGKIVENMNNEMDKSSAYIVIKKSADKIVFKDEEKNTTHIYTRIKDDKFKSLLTIKNKVSLMKLFGDPKRQEKGVTDQVGQQLRRLSSSLLAHEKFTFSPHLPTFSNRPKGISSLRDRKEILGRLLCFYAVNYWVLMPEEKMPSNHLQAFIKEFNLADKMSEKETAILALSREEANKQHSNNIGWKLENMFALAWVLGMDMCPEVTDAMAGDEVVSPLMTHIQIEIVALRAGKPLNKTRSLREVAQLEDIFYCAHNAVRSAQNGKQDTLPKDFHPILNGGIISEKRHALTWVLSPKIKWDDTNLDT